MEAQTDLLLQMNSKLDLILASGEKNDQLAFSSGPDEWLTPGETQRVFKFGKTLFWQLVDEKAFPITRPKPRTILVRRSDVEAYLRKHYSVS